MREVKITNSNERHLTFKMTIELKNISFSSVSSYYFCPRFFKLAQIEKLRTGNSVHTIYGKLLHKYIQDVLTCKITPSKASQEIGKTWKKFCKLYKLKEHENWIISTTKALLTVQIELTKQFGKYKVISVEERLTEKINDTYPQLFKGFIDLVLELEDKSVVVIDIKSCSTHFMFFKYKETFKDYQLTLYKHFLKQKNNIQKNIETYFMTVERDFKSKSPVKLTRVTSGPKKISNALKWVESCLSSVNNGIFLKNRLSCHKYTTPGTFETNACIFFNTPNCVSSFKK